MLGLFKKSVEKVKGWFGERREDAPEAPGNLTLRRWDSAETTRLNSAHWSRPIGQSVNADLVSDLETIRTRAAYEVANNEDLEGVINTFATDIGGCNGPKLQIRSDNKPFNEGLEYAWRKFWKKPDIRGMLGGVDYIQLWVRNLFLNGEFVIQKVMDRTAKGPIALRWKGIAPRRLATPPQFIGDADVIMGVRQTPEGKPVEYFISDPLRMGAFFVDTSKYTAVPAKDLMHRFLVIEEDQARGVPWLAVNLQSIADVRSYDAAVLKAAKNAARMAVWLSTNHPDANYMELNETTEIEDDMIGTLPPGWQPTQLDPKQPAINYVDYRSERQRGLGRPRNMPLMMVRLDSSKHNYSSARFDSQIYVRGCSVFRGWLDRGVLTDSVEDVKREVELYAAANPRWKYASAFRNPPEEYECVWTWPGFPAVDKYKESLARDMNLRNGTEALSDALAEDGRDIETHAAVRKRDNEILAASGLPPVPVEGPEDPAEDPDGDEKTATKAS